MILNVFPVLVVTENLVRDGVNGINPGGRPWNISFVPLSGLKRIMAGGYFSLMLPFSSALDISSLSSSIMFWISPHVPFTISASVARFNNTITALIPIAIWTESGNLPVLMLVSPAIAILASMDRASVPYRKLSSAGIMYH